MLQHTSGEIRETELAEITRVAGDTTRLDTSTLPDLDQTATIETPRVGVSALDRRNARRVSEFLPPIKKYRKVRFYDGNVMFA